MGSEAPRPPVKGESERASREPGVVFRSESTVEPTSPLIEWKSGGHTALGIMHAQPLAAA
jgi:hypothetical protein